MILKNIIDLNNIRTMSVHNVTLLCLTFIVSWIFDHTIPIIALDIAQKAI